MYVVYEPKGRAREYSDLACNLYMGCPHGCKYCFAPSCMHKTAEYWHTEITPRKNVISLFAKDARSLRGDSRKILFSFLSDPYQPLEKELHLTRQALEIVKTYHLKSQILTKGSYELIRDDFDLMKEAGTELGITISFMDDTQRQEWEPAAASVEERVRTLREAHELGIRTWVSLEPVLNAEQGLQVIRALTPFVDYWKVGKLNHMKEIEQQIDWKKFGQEAVQILNDNGANYYIKNDLMNIMSK
ncbi:MAG: radical SAM protein [Thermoguttaceae bacterium]|nr:radical SAM protein [Thermoguttaceae bacterium]